MVDVVTPYIQSQKKLTTVRNAINISASLVLVYVMNRHKKEFASYLNHHQINVKVMVERTTSISKLTGKTIVAAHLKHNKTTLALTLAGGRQVNVESNTQMVVSLLPKQ